jgi:CRISPR-associated protein Cmr2
MEDYWNDLSRAFLHDPPDKAADIKGHEGRAARYAAAALRLQVSEADLKQHADAVAAAMERLPMPTAGGGDRAVGPKEDGTLEIRHPLSAEKNLLQGVGIEELLVLKGIQELVDGNDLAPNARFLALWRLLPERLAAKNAWLRHSPADTRTPDHTIWQHLDLTAALSAAGPNNAAFLAFSLGPVQSFISASRSLRDLWTSSMILSWLAFQAMLPIITMLGPTALLYPALRGQPFLDLHLQSMPGLKPLIDKPSDELLKSPCLPNRFVAVVPCGPECAQARDLAAACERAAASAWKQICNAVHNRLNEQINNHVDAPLRDGWDRHWAGQVEHFFEFRSCVLPFAECFDDVLARLLTGNSNFSQAFSNAANVRALADALPQDQRPGGSHELVGRWQHRLELCMRLLASMKSIRIVAPSTPEESGRHVAEKCSLLGTYEQMGPAARDQARQFWEALQKPGASIGGVRLRARERLCAIALVKRFAGPAFFAQKLEISNQALRLDDTSTIAAALWLEQARQQGFNIDPDANRREHGSWSGQWLHRDEHDPDEEPCPKEVRSLIARAREHKSVGAPPAYYAVLMIDGDRMGEWLRGACSPNVHDVMHPRMADYYRGLSGETEKGKSRQQLVEQALAAPRPVGPALHAAISEALANFALHFVPCIVQSHHGELIYAGGDDVLALLPVSTVLSCARSLYETFRQSWAHDGNGVERLLMGPRATLSAGVAVVHHKEDLRYALERARQAEKSAKKNGRNLLSLHVCRRSGEHAEVLVPWPFIPTVEEWIQAFIGKAGRQGASDRWAYHLRAELSTLRGLELPAMRAEIFRHVDRAEKPTRELLGNGDASRAAELLCQAFDDYRGAALANRNGSAEPDRDGRLFEQFVMLCQAASFLARGRDR